MATFAIWFYNAYGWIAGGISSYFNEPPSGEYPSHYPF